MAASGHNKASPAMRTYAQGKARMRSPRVRRDIMSTSWTLYHIYRKKRFKEIVLFLKFSLRMYPKLCIKFILKIEKSRDFIDFVG